MASHSSSHRLLGSSHSLMHARRALVVTAPQWATMRRHYPTASSNYSLASHQSSASICWWEPEDGFSLGEDKWCCSFRTIGAALFGQLGCSLRNCASDQLIRASIRELWWLCAYHDVELIIRHRPDSRYAGRRHPQSGLSIPEMLRTFQGTGKGTLRNRGCTFHPSTSLPQHASNSSLSSTE